MVAEEKQQDAFREETVTGAAQVVGTLLVLSLAITPAAAGRGNADTRFALYP